MNLQQYITSFSRHKKYGKNTYICKTHIRSAIRIAPYILKISVCSVLHGTIISFMINDSPSDVLIVVKFSKSSVQFLSG